jgi:hypothetical protein
VVWQLERLRREMNINDVQKREQTEMLALPPCIITDKEKRRHHTRLWRHYHAEENKCVRTEW